MKETTQDLIQQGLTAARVGDLAEARSLLRQATEEMPDNPAAWLGLAGVVESLEDKRSYFSKVLELDPNNDEARAGLALVEQKLAQQHAEAVNAGVGVCYRHPEIETGLRCNRCNKFICPKCAVRTPVGFRCPDCIREVENKYYTGGNTDYVIAAVIAFPLSLIVATLSFILLGGLGFFQLLIAFFLFPAVAGFIAEAVRWGVGKRRSRYLRHVVIGSLVVATLPFLILGLFNGVLGAILPAMFIFLGSGAISVRLR
ncbi:MAG TPA: hypothetical protein PKE64_06320 [Anaerolineae bacterium]|nr:hypothetical protein [Anaerolineae bacterium]HMR63613.1 hypothetical protein [Anaerolineae bacterium]